MARQITAPPDSLDPRGTRPSTGNPLIVRYLEPLIISVAQKKLVKAGFDRNRRDWQKFENDFDIVPVEGLPERQQIQPRDNSWWFGSPVIDELIMSYDSYTDADGNTAPAGGIVLQNILLTVSQAKNIQRTKVQGHKGTIKQFISEDDFEIQAVGKVIAPPRGFTGTYTLNGGSTIRPQGEFQEGQRPNEELMQLIRVLRAQIEIDVNSPFLNLFDIDKCIIGPYTLPNEEGRLDNQYLRFTMWSDEPFDVTTGAQV